MKNDLYQKTIFFVDSLLKDDSTGHDTLHAQRVYRLSLHISKHYSNINEDILFLTSLLHDVDDSKLFAVGSNNAKRFLDSLFLPQEEKDEILDNIARLSYHTSIQGICEITQEGKIVQDADRLDALGAIGIARCFSYGGSRNRKIFDDEKPKDTSLAHFDEKLFKLINLFNTEEGKKLAVERTNYMKKYVEEFQREWDFGKDNYDSTDCH
jgi:uncharacterized protein